MQLEEESCGSGTAHVLCPWFLADTNACWRDSFLNDVVMEGASPSITSGTGRKGLDLNCLPKVQVLKTWSPDDGDAGMGWKLQEVRSLHSLLM